MVLGLHLPLHGDRKEGLFPVTGIVMTETLLATGWSSDCIFPATVIENSLFHVTGIDKSGVQVFTVLDASLHALYRLALSVFLAISCPLAPFRGQIMAPSLKPA